MENFELFLEKSHTQRDYYSAGEEIKGHVAISTKGSVRVARLSLRFIGAAHTEWHDKCTGAPFESVDRVLDEYRDLTSELSSLCDGSTELSPGEHSVAFHFKLPMDSVSTIAKDGHGVVKYFCVASLDLPDDGGDNEIVAEKEFAVTAYLNLDAPHFREPAHSSEQITKGGVFCGRIRRVKAELCVEELGLMTGETCEVTLTVENTAKRGRRKSHAGEGHKCGLISLCQQVDFKAKAKTGEWQKRSLTTAVQSQGICKANCAKKPEIRRTQFIIPDDLPPTSTKENGLIICSYFFRIEMEEHFDVIVPVIIGSHKNKKDSINRICYVYQIPKNGSNKYSSMELQNLYQLPLFHFNLSALP